MPQSSYVFNVPKLSSQQALTLCKRLTRKIKNLNDERRYEDKAQASLSRCELIDLLDGLEKLEERLQWGI